MSCKSPNGMCVNHGACNANDGCMYEPKKKPKTAPADRISTLEARIAELERELAVQVGARDEACRDWGLERADRDEAVRQMREALNGFDKQTSLNCWREDDSGDYVITATSAHEFVVETRKLLLALHPAQPETPGKETT